MISKIYKWLSDKYMIIMFIWSRNTVVLVLWLEQGTFIAHLSQRLTRWACSIASLCRPSSSSSVVVVVHTFEQKYLQDQLASFSQILSVASLGWEKGCIMFRGRSDQNSHWHITGKTLCCVFSVTFNRSFVKLAGNEVRHEQKKKKKKKKKNSVMIAWSFELYLCLYTLSLRFLRWATDSLLGDLLYLIYWFQ